MLVQLGQVQTSPRGCGLAVTGVRNPWLELTGAGDVEGEKLQVISFGVLTAPC